MQVQIHETWQQVLRDEFEKPYFAKIVSFLKKEKQNGKIIFPKGQDIFSAFNNTPFNKIKVVILGQDPYHGANQAHGLCFSVQKGVDIPPSLKNIYKEIKTELGFEIPTHGHLIKWAKQGVFMLNASLTVEQAKPMSHSNIGWEIFTDAVIKKISGLHKNIVFLLWGKFAQQKESLIDSNKHFILKAAHPSPLSAHNGFWGCNHFIKTNEFLIQKNLSTIDWKIINND